MKSWIPVFAILFLVLASCGKVPSIEPGAPVLHFEADFEDRSLSPFYLLVSDTSVNTTFVTHPVRRGLHALKNTLRPGDYVFNGYRTELAIYECAEYQQEVFYGFSFLIDSAYGDPRFNLVCQWQDLPYYEQGEDWNPAPVLHGASPPVALIYADGKLELKMNENPSSDDHAYIVGEPVTINKGEWIDMVFRIFWSDKQDGFIEVWINGDHLTSFNGTDHRFFAKNLYTRDGNYFKFGQYRGKNDPLSTGIIYFDEVKIGTSYAEVAP
jgi:Polysaccharide lyase